MFIDYRSEASLVILFLFKEKLQLSVDVQWKLQSELETEIQFVVETTRLKCRIAIK